ncbi:MAG: tRNA (adenosine(37)-N6)-threonylcarbamoyltransferase complex dimerization subunit type 1 TsaB, partial [Rhodothermales bacterium]|nr:tRNA (adenosine(37)-N6)-threonylcarbamoyltransferase complex dimerization subunit type 1 TsaB [Rhodothermales bacterium]
GPRLVAEVSLRRPRAHAEQLVPMVGEALRLAGRAAADLGAVAVSQGPGSYTGLRIGASTAKGLALAAGARLVAVPSLEALAARAAPFASAGDLVLPAFNARRDEVYVAAFRVDASRVDAGGALTLLKETAALSPAALAAWAPPSEGGGVWLLGEGAAQTAPALAEAGIEARALGPEAVAPSAAAVARRAWPRIEAGAFEDVAAFEPFYLKAFVAKKPKGSIFDRLPS